MAKADAGQVIHRLRLTAGEFDWGQRSGGGLNDRVDLAIADASTKTKVAVGAGNYASTEATMAEALTYAETCLACAMMLRQRLVILSSRPEEAPPPEYTHLEHLQAEIDRYERDWAEAIAPYQVEEFAAVGTGCSFGSWGLDETEEDDYDDIDYGALPK